MEEAEKRITAFKVADKDKTSNFITRSGRISEDPAILDKQPVDGTDPRVPTENDKVQKQLQKTNANITLWELLVTSQEHRTALIKQLSTASVPTDLSPEDMTATIGSITMQRSLSFSDDDLPRYGANHNYALYITVEIQEQQVPLVLIDNGSTVNVCPLRTVTKLGYKATDFTPSSLAIRAYDDTRRAPLGTIKLTMIMGPIQSTAEFQILDIPASFNLLLGRSWIHPIGALPSTLHMKVKIPFEQKVVTIQGNEGLATIATTSTTPAFQHSEQDISLRGFRVVADVQMLDKELPSQNPTARMMQKMNFLPGLGLGKISKVKSVLINPRSTKAYLDSDTFQRKVRTVPNQPQQAEGGTATSGKKAKTLHITACLNHGGVRKRARYCQDGKSSTLKMHMLITGEPTQLA
jgi:hypothetical protein